jgi:hypothetical protein
VREQRRAPAPGPAKGDVLGAQAVDPRGGDLGGGDRKAAQPREDRELVGGVAPGSVAPAVRFRETGAARLFQRGLERNALAKT